MTVLIPDRPSCTSVFIRPVSRKMRLLARYRLAASFTPTHETRMKQTRTASPMRHSMVIMTAIGRM